ncbi:methyltransferase domain-containing protein [Leisingera sp. ANG-S5]|uniref:methyltransferase domain-containing protein n=1 Tax=Leisingera sp. ANG-S5 TaxID=1577901 RepID=UPI0009E2666E|nr:methyltransferase domain-containing protein [Leisingera sp. ANG-S5]
MQSGTIHPAQPANGSQADLPRAIGAMQRQEWEEARRILVPLAAQKPKSVASFHLARLELEAGDTAAAETHLNAFLEFRPRHPGALALKARVALIRGELELASELADEALEQDPKNFGALSTRSQIDDALNTKAAAQALETLNSGYLKARQDGPDSKLLAAAATLAELDPGNRWNDDTTAAAIAYFKHAGDLQAALRNYDPHLISASVELDYITWPKRIQPHIRGGAVLDVGCGFGGYGMGFLIAGAKSYTGLDPVMQLDSTKARNKRTRSVANLGVTPREISASLPAINLIQGKLEDLHIDSTFHAISLHNVTEHLIQLEQVFKELATLCKKDAKLIYTHHNYYCWNGHHGNPAWPEQLDTDNPEHLRLYDWNHIEFAVNAPEDDYVRTHLNRVRLDEIRSVTEKYFDIETWQKIPSSPSTLSRLTPEVLGRIRKTIPDIEERELTTNLVFCVAAPKPPTG